MYGDDFYLVRDALKPFADMAGHFAPYGPDVADKSTSCYGFSIQQFRNAKGAFDKMQERSDTRLVYAAPHLLRALKRLAEAAANDVVDSSDINLAWAAIRAAGD